MMGLFLDELEVGHCVRLGSYSFTQDNINRFNAQFAPGFDQAQGFAAPFHVCAAWMRCFVEANKKERDRLEETGRDLPAIGAGFGLQDVEWPGIVQAGDQVFYSSAVTAVRPMASNPQWGVLSMLNEGWCGDTVVVRFASHMMVARR